MPFNYIFQAGFSSCLNFLISNAKNDMVLYLNTSEVIDENYGINEIINSNTDCNCFYFKHSVETHRWFRCFDRRFIQWSGRIHEEPLPISGENQPYHKPIFQMKDLEKDMGDTFKASVFNMVKNIVYFEQYRKIEENPRLLAGTNEGWLKWVKEQSPKMEDRLLEFGNFYKAFQLGDFGMFMKALENYDTSDFDFTSNELINFQGARKIIL